MWGLILKKCDEHLPPFNDFLLHGYKEKQISNCANFIGTAFEEAMKLFGPELGKIEYLGYRVLSPEERMKFVLDNNKFTPAIDVNVSELMLVQYEFLFDNMKYYSQLYLPYLKNECITISGIRYFLQLAITDKIFYHISNGVGIKVMRAPLSFYRDIREVLTSTVNHKYPEDVITAGAYHANVVRTKQEMKTPLLLYILATKGYLETLRIFNIEPHMCQVVTECNNDDPHYEYFKIRGNTCTFDMQHLLQMLQNTEPGLYLKVHKDILLRKCENAKEKMRVVASILYTLSYFRRYQGTSHSNNEMLIQKIYNSTEIFVIILGKTIRGLTEDKETQLMDQAVNHLGSLQTYLDPITELMLRTLRDKEQNVIGTICNDIYDLFIYVFRTIDIWIVNHSYSSLYDKKINVTDLLLSKIVKMIFNKVYSKARPKRPLTHDDVRSLFRMNPEVISQINKDCVAVTIQTIYNDNWLMSVGGHRVRANHSGVRQGQSKSGSSGQRDLLTDRTHRYHPSFMVVETTGDVPNSAPGTSGTINPFLPIDEDGSVIRPSYAEAAEELSKHLPMR